MLNHVTISCCHAGMPWWWPRCGCGRWIAARHWFYGRTMDEDLNNPWRCPRCREGDV